MRIRFYLVEFGKWSLAKKFIRAILHPYTDPSYYENNIPEDRTEGGLHNEPCSTGPGRLQQLKMRNEDPIHEVGKVPESTIPNPQNREETTGEKNVVHSLSLAKLEKETSYSWVFDRHAPQINYNLRHGEPPINKERMTVTLCRSGRWAAMSTVVVDQYSEAYYHTKLYCLMHGGPERNLKLTYYETTYEKLMKL